MFGIGVIYVVIGYLLAKAKILRSRVILQVKWNLQDKVILQTNARYYTVKCNLKDKVILQTITNHTLALF